MLHTRDCGRSTLAKQYATRAMFKPASTHAQKSTAEVTRLNLIHIGSLVVRHSIVSQVS